MARVARVDGGETPPGSRLLTDLDRLEEYSATHAETFDQLGEWPADRFEAAWESYRVRSTLADISDWEDGMKRALYSNGMIGGDALSKEVNSIQEHAEALRARLLDTDLAIEEETLAQEAPYPVTAEANPDG